MSPRILLTVLMGAIVAFAHVAFGGEVVSVEPIGADRFSAQWVSGNLRQLVFETAANGRQTIPVETVAGIQLRDGKLRAIEQIAGSSWIVLASGERLRAQPSVIDDASLTVSFSQLKAVAPIQIPLEACRGFTLSLPSDPIRQGLDWQRLVQRRVESDLIQLKNGDRVDGEFVGLVDAKFRTKTSLGEVVSEFGAVRSLAFNPSLSSVPKRPARLAYAILVDGSVLCLEELTMNGEFCVVKSISGFSMELPTNGLAEVRFMHQRAELLSDRAPDLIEVNGLLGTKRKPLANVNVVGGPLLIGGVPFGNGWGVPSGSRLSWDLKGEYQAFTAVVGVDDSAASGGIVEFEIIVDDRSVWRSSKLRGRDGPLRTPLISMVGAKRLSLVVLASDLGSVLDFADWCHPTLYRGPR